MTFYFGMLIVVPEVGTFRVPGNPPSETNIKIWRIEHALDLSAIKENFGTSTFKQLSKKDRARAYFLDLLLPEFAKHADSGALSFAPMFVLYPDDMKHHLGEKELIVPLNSSSRNRPVPTHLFMEAHNDALKGGPWPDSFDGIKSYGSPLMWLECGRVYEMLSLGSERTRTLAVADADAYRFLNIWENMLANFDQIGGKVIFLFGPAAADSLPIGEF